MLSPTDIMFWQAVLPPICLLTIPIILVSGAPLWRSFLTASVIYILLCFVSACNIAPPF